MKKRLLAAVMALSMVLGTLPGTARAAEAVASGECGADGDNITWSLDSDGVLTISGTGDMQDYVNESENMSSPWYDAYRTSIETVTIEDGITSIGTDAFDGCSSLTDISIPDSVSSINEWAFQGCSSLTSIVLPDNVSSIENGVFSGCSGLTSVSIPDSVSSIGDFAFDNCSGLTSVSIPDHVSSIGDHAFSGCSGLTSIVLPDSVSSIGGHVFDGCGGLTSVVIPGSISSIGASAFSSCGGLTSIVIPDGVSSIGDRAFSGCGSLTSVSIPDSVSSIGTSAFSDCSSLTSISIPASVSTIENSVFSGCSSLTSVSIPEGVSSIGDHAFSDCGLTSIVIPDSISSLGNGVFSGCSGLTSIAIPNGISSIGTSTFYDCTGLASVSIPESVSLISEYAFYGCTGLADVQYSGTEAQWQQISIGPYNDPLHSAVIHFNGEPAQQPVSLADGVQYVPYSWKPEGSNGSYTISGGLPSGLEMNSSTGEISGVPTAHGTFSFVLSGERELSCTLTIADNTDTNVWNAADAHYSIVEPVGVPSSSNSFILDAYQDEQLTSSGSYQAFQALYIDGQQLVLNADYTVSEGSTIINIFGKTFETFGPGTHTIALAFRENETLKRAAQNYTFEKKSSALPNGIKYVPYSWKPESQSGSYEIIGTLPSGLRLNGETGEIYGVPMVSNNTWDFSIQAGGVEYPYTLTVVDNTNSAVQQPNEYPIIQPIGTPSGGNSFYLDTYRDEQLIIDGPYAEFMRVLINGRELIRYTEYDVESGSTVITVYAQTFRNIGNGTHTIAAEFREGGKPDGKLKTVSQNYTANVRPASPTPSNKKHNTNKSTTPAPTTPTTPAPEPVSTPEPAMTGLPFSDIQAESWYYDDVKWVYENEIMGGTTNTSFSPNTDISQATIVTVLARMAGTDLSDLANVTDSTIASGKWYSEAAIWAKQSGLLPDHTTFTGEESITRDQMAIMLVKYLRSMGRDTTPPAQAVTFSDAAQMSADGNNAFQVLCRHNIFRGVGENRMDPAGSTTRAQFAALVHRLDTLAKQ